MNNQDQFTVVIVGAGIAGLTAAWYLKKRGYKVELIEERAHLGGKLGAHLGRVKLTKVKNPSDPNDTDKIDGIDDETGEINGDQLPGQIKVALSLTLDVNQANLAVQNGIYTKSLLPDALPPQTDEKKVVTVLTEPLGSLEEAVVACNYADDGKRLGRFNVAVFESLDKKRSFLKVTDDVYHEHCYHMYLNWYKNFWSLMKEIGIEQTENFSEVSEYSHLFPGTAPIKTRLRVRHNWDNWSDDILSGTASVPDMLLGVYSILDLVGESLTQDRYFDRISTHGFMASRWYASETSVRMHEFMLAKAFAVPVYFSSAFAYRRYLQYTMYDPDPLMWTLNKNSFEGIFKRFGEVLDSKKPHPSPGSCTIHRRQRVSTLKLKEGKVEEVIAKESDMRPPGKSGNDHDSNSAEPRPLPPYKAAYVIVATPPAALAEIVNDFRHAVPGLSTVHKLNSASTAVLDLFFKCKLNDIPAHHVMLRDSNYGLTFVDNSQVWKHDPNFPGDFVCMHDGKKVRPTCLSVAVTDFYKIEGMDKRDATRVVLEDLQRFIDFDLDDVDLTRTFLEMNQDDPLFLNEVGSEPWRPGTRTDIPNLFLAGDFVENEIGVVCVEGAVMSGLLAARAVQAQVRQDYGLRPDDPLVDPIPIETPETYPLANANALKLLLSPYIPWAKTTSRMREQRRHPERMFSPEDFRTDLEDALLAPGNLVQDVAKSIWDGAQWISSVPHNKNRR